MDINVDKRGYQPTMRLRWAVYKTLAFVEDGAVRSNTQEEKITQVLEQLWVSIYAEENDEWRPVGQVWMAE